MVVSDDGTNIGGIGLPWVNENGDIAFVADLRVPTATGFLLVDRILLIAGDGISVIPELSNTSVRISQGQKRVSVNDLGVVAFAGKLVDGTDGGASIFTSDGGSLRKVIDATGPFADFFSPSINSNGVVAFRALLDSGVQGLFTVDALDVVSTIVDTAGPFNTFISDHVPFNNQGGVAFVAGLDNGGFGIFTGPDPVADKVITGAEIEAMWGSGVDSLFVGRDGLNDSGQIVFRVTLRNDRSLIVRADPVD
jgi:hypothetical protein